jgi:hypothetical protein
MFYSCVEPGTPTEEVISVLNRGTSLHKVRSLDKFYCRRYYVDLHNMRLHYSPSQKQYLCREVPYGMKFLQYFFRKSKANVFSKKYFTRKVSKC